MKRRLIPVFICLSMIGTGKDWVSAASDCTKSAPEVFRSTSPSVVSVAAVSIDPLAVRDRVSTTIGSGFIIDPSGLVITNYHIIEGCGAITATLSDGHTERAVLVGIDPILDLAILRILVPSQGLTPVQLGDSTGIEVGEDVLAIGNPFGLGQTLTRGVISGIHPALPSAPMSIALPVIQSDAAIQPGSSGGPLVNLCGEVIGINTAMFERGPDIGFAIPIHLVKAVLPQLLKEGRVIRPWLGVVGKLVGAELGQIINLPIVDGFLVESVEPDSPAEQAGLQGGDLPISLAGMEFLLGGDIITSANGMPLSSPENLNTFIESLEVGEKVHLTVYHEGKTQEMDVRINERPTLLPFQ
jgi:serine protease Do